MTSQPEPTNPDNRHTDIESQANSPSDDNRQADSESQVDLSLDNDRLQLAERSFKNVLEADVHQDNKAGRILAAIAFLTAAATGLFNSQYSPSLNPRLRESLANSLAPYVNPNNLKAASDSLEQSFKQNFQLFGIDVALYSFVVYLLCVFVGVGLYLAAMGPSFNIPSWFKHHQSLLFFEAIAGYSREEWNAEWAKGKSTAEIHQKVFSNFVDETYLIAQKTRLKVALMSIGKLFFRLAVIALIPLSISLLKLDSNTAKLLIVGGVSVSLLTQIFRILIKPSKKIFDWYKLAFWGILTIGLIYLGFVS